MNTAKIRFKTFNGEISFTDARTKSQEPWNHSARTSPTCW
jgi:hypothetical protein